MIKTINLKLREIKPNPFKKEINMGKLNDNTISKLLESIEHGTLPEVFTVRKLGDDYELCFGHHRKEALIRAKGREHLVLCNVVERTDEQMLIDMARENLVQRSDDFKEERATVLFVKKYLSKLTGGYPKDTCDKSGRKKHQNISQGIGARQIAEFLSKNGRAVSKSKVAEILRVNNKLDSKIIEKIERATNQTDKRSPISFKIAQCLTKLDKPDQRMLVKKIEKEHLGAFKVREMSSDFHNADQEIKQKVRKREIGFEDIKIEEFKKRLKEKAKEQEANQKNRITVTHIKKYQRETGNLIGETNHKILKTCARLDYLQREGIIRELNFDEMYKILEAGQLGGKRYTKFMEVMIGKL